ncbi:MAG: 2-oxo acid dehydrogenase subunit E2 [Oceanospirillaceae bacterium]|nr:2-oxo acid dehydrogenase subunit E2 [Oceanospirillaceae bacterium]
MNIFKLPDLGEGLPEAEIVEWFIKEGDSVTSDQVIVAMETAKAIVEIPSPSTGVISKLYGSVGDIIHTGDPLLEFAQADTAQDTSPSSASTESNSVVGEISTDRKQLNERPQASSGNSHIGVKATPAVRALAKRHDIDLSVITPSGPDGTIKASDVERVVKIYAQVGQLQPLKGVRRAMAKTMAQAHLEVVPVTIIDDADIYLWPKGTDVTGRLVRAIILACKTEPSLNAWYDSHSIGRRLLQQVHLGLAVDTKDGLFVPVIKDVAQYDPTQLRAKISEIKSLVSNRKIPVDQLRGNSITLSNFGSIGGKYANPIVVPPTIAIIGAGRSFSNLVMHNGEIQEHNILPLSLTFDHRAATGAEAARFMQALIEDLSAKD